jgi:hypothetical protein
MVDAAAAYVRRHHDVERVGPRWWSVLEDAATAG